MFMSVAALPLYHFGDIVAEFNMFVFLGSLAVLALCGGSVCRPTCCVA